MGFKDYIEKKMEERKAKEEERKYREMEELERTAKFEAAKKEEAEKVMRLRKSIAESRAVQQKAKGPSFVSKLSSGFNSGFGEIGSALKKGRRKESSAGLFGGSSLGMSFGNLYGKSVMGNFGGGNIFGVGSREKSVVHHKRKHHRHHVKHKGKRVVIYV